MAPPVPRSSRSPIQRNRSATPGFINPPPLEPSSPDHLTTATPISELPLPLPPRSKTCSPSRRQGTRSPEKKQKNPSIITTATQPSPNKFVASTIFTPSRTGGGRVLNFNANGGSGRAGGASIRGNSGVDIGEESWRIKVVVEAEREDGNMVTGAGEGVGVAARGSRGRGRGRARVRSATPHGGQTPRARKATPTGRGRASQAMGGGGGQEDQEEAHPMVVRKKRTKTDTPHTTKSRTRTMKAKAPVLDGVIAGGTGGGGLSGDSDSDGPDRFSDAAGETEDEQRTSCPPQQIAKGKARDGSTETRQPKPVVALTTENLGVQVAPERAARTRRTRKTATMEREQDTSEVGESLPMRKVRAPIKAKVSNSISSPQLEGGGVQLPATRMDWHQEGEDEEDSDSSMVMVPKTRIPGTGPTTTSPKVRKRVTATSTIVGTLGGSLRTSTAASDAIRQRRQARERNVTPAERAEDVVLSLDSPTFSSPNNAAPLRVPKTRQSQNSNRSTIASLSPTNNPSPSIQSLGYSTPSDTRRVVSSGSLQSHQTVTPPPTSSPSHMHSRSPLGEMQGNRVNSVATSPQQRSTSEDLGEKSRSVFVDDGGGSPIYWADFASHGDSDSSDGHGDNNSHDTASPPPCPEIPASPMTTPAPWQLPTPAATQCQQRIQSTRLGGIDNDWLPSTPVKHIYQRTGSVASITSWPDVEEDGATVTHQRVSSVESVSHLNTDIEGLESQPGSVRRSSVVTSSSDGKRRRRIMDILPDNYESRRTLFDGVVPPRSESLEVLPEVPKRKGKQKSVGFGATVEIPSRVIMSSPPPLPAQEDEEPGKCDDSGFNSSPPPQGAWEEDVRGQGPQTPGYATKPELSSDLFVPKRRYIEVSKAAVAGRQTPDLTRCRTASVVLQRTILGELGGGDNGGIPRVFGGYLVRVEDLEQEAEGGPSIVDKGKARVIDVDPEEIGKGNSGLVTRSARKPPTPGPSSVIQTMDGPVSTIGGVPYSMLPTWRAPWFDASTIPSLAPEAMGNENQYPRPEKVSPSTKGASASTNRNTFGNISTAPLSTVIGTTSPTNTSSNSRRYSSAIGRGSADGNLQKQPVTPMKERDLRSRLLETLTRSRKKLGVRRSVTPPRSLSISEPVSTGGKHSGDDVRVSGERGENTKAGVDVDIGALIQAHLLIQEEQLREQQEGEKEPATGERQQPQAEGVVRTNIVPTVPPRITRESTVDLAKRPTRSMGQFPTASSAFATIEPASAQRKMTLEERWEAERQDNIRKAEEFGAIVLDDSTLTEGSIHESEVDEAGRDGRQQNGGGRQAMEVIIKESEPETILGLMENEVEEEEEGYTGEEQEEEEGDTIVFRRRGLRRDLASVPAAGIPVTPTTPIRRPFRLPQEGIVHGREYAAHSYISPSARKCSLPQQKSYLETQRLATPKGGMSVGREEREQDRETSQMITSDTTAIPLPSLAARLFSGWWGKPGKSGGGDGGFTEMLPAELVCRASNPPRGHDSSGSENWMLNSTSSSLVGEDRSASRTYTETETEDYSGTDTYDDVEGKHGEAKREVGGTSLYAPRTPTRRLRPGTTWKTEHWALLDELMHDLPSRNHPVTPPRVRQRYEVYKRNRLRELRGHAPSLSPSPSPSPMSLPVTPSILTQKSRLANPSTLEPTFRIPIIGWEFTLSLPWRMGLPTQIIPHLRYSPYPLRRPPRQPQQDPPPSPNWRQNPAFTLDHRERTVVTWFVEEAKTRFGELWEQEVIAEMVIAWGLGRCKVASGDAAGRVSLSGVPEEVKRRAYYGGIQIIG